MNKHKLRKAWAAWDLAVADYIDGRLRKMEDIPEQAKMYAGKIALEREFTEVEGWISWADLEETVVHGIFVGDAPKKKKDKKKKEQQEQEQRQFEEEQRQAAMVGNARFLASPGE